MNSEILETVLRTEVRLAGEKWLKRYKEASDEKRLELLGKLAARRLIAEEQQRLFNAKQAVEGCEQRKADPEIAGTKGPLGNDSGGGKRVLKSTKSLS